MKIKKIFTSFIALSFLFSLSAAFTQNKAHASVLVFRAVPSVESGAQVGVVMLGIALAGTGGYLGVSAIQEAVRNDSNGSKVVPLALGSAALLLLDAQVDLKNEGMAEALANGLTQKFPFVDNTEIFLDVSKKFAKMYSENHSRDSKVSLSLSRSEAFDVLSPIADSVTSDQLEMLVSAFTE